MFNVHLYNSKSKQNALAVNKGERREIPGGLTVERQKGYLPAAVRFCTENEMGRSQLKDPVRMPI